MMSCVDRLAVIAATGTRDYYRARGFELGELYMTLKISNSPDIESLG